MPKVIVKTAPGPTVEGRWVLGTGPRQKLNADGSPQKDASGNPTYWPARSGVYIPAGQDVELTITDEELKDLQSGANAQLFVVMVTDESVQPAQNEGGSSMATNPLNQPPNPPPPGTSTPGVPVPNAPTPGSTVPPGTTPQPTPPATPTSPPAPETPRRAK